MRDSGIAGKKTFEVADQKEFRQSKNHI